jgi:hypothetical protein
MLEIAMASSSVRIEADIDFSPIQRALLGLGQEFTFIIE